jgi:hypothetical protein
MAAWFKQFAEPVVLPDSHALLTPRDTAEYIATLPAADRDRWYVPWILPRPRTVRIPIPREPRQLMQDARAHQMARHATLIEPRHWLIRNMFASRKGQTMWNRVESNRVIGLRIAKAMRGGNAAQREARRMVIEKMIAAAKAGTSLMAGASGDKIVAQCRRKVAANTKRLSRNQTQRK